MSWSTIVLRWQLFWKNVRTSEIIRNNMVLGLKNTFLIAFIGFFIGVVLGSILAIVKLLPQNKKSCRFFSKLCDIYVAIFRGTPIVVQLLVSFYVILPIMGIEPKALIVCEVMFGLNSAAYVCEIMRSGIQSVDKGQMEAGRSLGLSFMKTMMKIVLPQAVKNILPTLGNELISLIKETSVVSFVGATDLYTAFNKVGLKTYDFLIPYLMVAIVYIVIVVCLTMIIKIIERRLRASERR